MPSTVTPYGMEQGPYHPVRGDEKTSKNRRTPGVEGVPLGSPMAQNGRVKRSFRRGGKRKRAKG